MNNTRFIKKEFATELINLYHTARSYTGKRYDGMILACKWFIEKHPEYSKTQAYKDLDGLLS